MKYFFNIGTLGFLGVVLALISLGFLIKYIKILIRAGKKSTNDSLNENKYIQAHIRMMETQVSSDFKEFEAKGIEKFETKELVFSTDIDVFWKEEHER